MFKKKLLNKAIMATVLGGMMLAPSFALGANVYKWDMKSMTTLGTTTTIVAAKANGQLRNVYKDGDHYTLNGKSWMMADKIHLYYSYDYDEEKKKGEVVGEAIAPMQSKGGTTNCPSLYFTLKASDLPDNYTVAELDGIFQKLLAKYVNVYDTSNNFYKNCILQLVDDAGNQLYKAEFDTVDKVPHYLAISAKTFYETDLKDVGNSKDKAFVVGTAQEQSEVALGKSSLVTSETIFKLPTTNTLENDGIIYGIFNDKQGKISGSGGKLTLNAGTDAAPERSIGIYAGNNGDYVSEVNLSFDNIVIITAGRYGLEAGKNGKITVSGAESGTGGMSVKTVQDGYAVYAHDGGVADVIYGGSGQLHLGHTTTTNLPANDAMLYAEKGGVINVDSQGTGKMQIKLGGLANDTAKALTDTTGIINLKMSGSGGTLQVNADGNVNITLAGGNTWEGTAAGNTTLTGGNKSMWKYASTDAQHLAAFTGAKTEGYNAFVTMAGGNVAIDKYAGNGLFFVSDSVGTITINSADVSTTGGEANPLLNNITKDTLYFDSANDGGKIIPAGYENVPGVGETANSVITLATTTNLTDSVEIKELLTGLADKLVYTGAAGGETNLDVKMAVVDSTAVNANIKKFAVVSFDAMGNKTLGELQTPETPDGLHVQILGGGETGSVYTAYTTKDKDGNNVYTFDKDLIINRYSKTQIDGMKQSDFDQPFWSPIFGAFKAEENPNNIVKNPSAAEELNYTVDMQGHKLTAKNFYETGRTANNDRATIVTLAREGSITFNNVAGMDLEAVADYYYTAAINVTEYSPNNIPVKGAHITVNNLAGWDNAVKATSYLAGGEAAYAMDNYIIFADGRNLPKDTPKNTLTIDIANLVDVDATKGQFGVTAWGRGATINVGGGRIVATSLPALSTAGATCELNFNVLKDASGNVTGAGNNPVQIVGDVKNNTPWYGTGGVINLGLNTADSYLKGFTNTDAGKPLTEMVADMYSEGTINMWMGNGAQWINTGVSHVNKLVGGTTAGVLDMTDAAVGNVTIDSYSGNMVALYKHKNDGDEVSDYSAANITISSATAGSTITLITDNTGISDVTKADATLNALASKLYYLGVNNNLTGKVEIAEGLTSSSQSLRLANITFDSTGAGAYAPPMVTQKITGDKMADTAYWAITKKDQSTTGLSGVSKATFTKYTFTDTDNYSAGVAVTDKDVWLSGAKNLNINLSADSGDVQGISVTGPGEFYDQNTRPVINVEAKNGKAQGIYVAGADAGNKTYAQIGGAATISAKGTDAGIGLYVTGNSSVKTGALTVNAAEASAGYGYYGASAVYACSDYVLQQGPEVNVAGALTAKNIKGNVVFANGGNSKITVGTGSTAVDISVDSSNTNGYAALRAECGQIDVNMKSGAAGTGKVTMLGNVAVTTGAVFDTDPGTETVINLALNNSGSTWTGVAYNNFEDEGNKTTNKTFTGAINLWLGEGSQWTNEAYGVPTFSDQRTTQTFNGSHVANLTGGSTVAASGIIFQKDSNPLTIDNYSRNVKVFYVHTNDGDEAGDYAAGDIKIGTAAAGSVITLVTDNTGINDVSGADATLNALAGKLYYLAHATGEDNLTAVAEIAEGLTSTSVSLRQEYITFGQGGKGGYDASASIYKDSQTGVTFTAPITGVEPSDMTYVKAGVLRKDGKYHLDDDTTITDNGTGSDYSTIINNGPITIDGEGKKLTLNVTGDADRIQAISQVGITNPITITVDTLKIDVSDSKRTEGILATNTESQAVKPVLTINGNVDMKLRAGATAAYGLHVYSYAGINITGDVAIKGDGTGDDKWGINAYGTDGKTIGNSYFGNAAIHVQSQMQNNYSGSIVIGGDVDVMAQSAGLYINGGSGVIEIKGGGKIEIDPTVYAAAKFGDAVYGAMRSELGYIYMNVVKDSADGVRGNVTGVGTKQVNILGNVIVSRGADNAKSAPDHLNSIINLGLSTADSTWTGVAYNAYSNAEDDVFRGEINLWLQNGATWTNELYGVTGNPYSGLKFSGNEGDKAVYDGSRINKLVGGSTADKAGVIFQKDSNPLTIDNYSGNVKVFYTHTNDGDEVTDYVGGDIKIKEAAAGSAITLITDNEGIAKVSKADGTLNVLASKLYYLAGDGNLTGKVEIAEGLTASSASMRLESITFDSTDGQGIYKEKVEHSTGGGEDPEPVVDPEPVEEPTVYDGGLILNDGDNVVINKDVETTCYSKSYAAAGIAMMIGGTGVGAESHLTINGKVTMGTDDEHPGVVAEDKHGAYGFYAGTRWTGAGINMNQGHGSTITITKGLEIYADGHGIVTDPYYCDKKYADKDLAVVTVNGPTTIHVGSDEDVGLYALANYGGTININMKNGQPGTDKVDIFGNAIVMKDTMGESKNPYFYRSGEINLALTTADSLWTGAVDNTGTTQVGDFNLYLQNGGTWDYQPASRMDGLSASTMPTPSNGFYGSYDEVSHIANLTGGSDDASRGVIRVNYDDTLAIANYSGNVLVAYEHDEVNPTIIYGGNIKVAKAKVGSVITLFTDKKGVDSSNYTAVLNALAGKLYYTGGDEALIGQVQIGEGLTSQSVTYEGYIAYGANGQGKYTSEKGTTVVETPIGEGTGEGAFKVEETDDAKTIKMDEKPKMVSVTTGSALKNSGDKPLIIDNPQATLVLQSADKTSPVVAADKGDVKIKGAVEVIGVPGQKLMDVAEGKKMDLAGGEFTAVPDPEHPENPPMALVLAEKAVVSIGMPAAPAQPGAPAPKPLPVKLTGDIQNNEGTLNVNLGTPDSFWKGNYQNKDAKLILTIDNKDAKWEGKVNGAKLNVNLNAGTWVNKGKSYSTSGNFTLNAGGVKKAFIDMTQGSGNITIDKYSGGMTLIYSNDESTPTTIDGSSVTIKFAAENSVVNLWTDGKGLDLTTEVDVDTAKDTAVKEVLNALAKKLTYEGYQTEGHITGEVGVGEALTRPAVTFPKAAALMFAEADSGKGSIDASTFKDSIAHGEVVYGDSETAMMRGAKMAMASTAMIWRAEANDLTKRMGDLQLRKEEAGVWAKYYSGRQEYNNNGSFSNKYKAVQFGVDKTLGHGWLGGIAFSYDDGSGSLNNGGRADNKVQSLGFYGTKVNKNGEYIDLIGKFSRLENEYTVYNDYGYSLDGDYKNFGMSVSAEYGKHINLKNGLVLTPAVEFTLGRVNSKNYDAYSEYYEKSMTVKQDAFNSAIGRIGISLGKETGAYSYYAKLGLAHEFAGGFDTTYSAPGEPTSGTSVDFKDTWKEVQVGGSVKLKNDALLYGSFSKSFGGDVKEKWRVDAGLMFTFNHISDFFGNGNKTQKTDVEEVAVSNLTNQVQQVETAAPVIAGTQVENESVTVGDSVAVAEVKPVKSSGNTYVMDECIVTASKTKQRITDATADVSVVTRAEIEAMHMNSVEEALRTVPGVEFNNYGSGNQMNANISSLRINGSKDVALLVDGVKINDFQGVGEAGNMYAGVLNNMNNIERVEVLRGAAGVLYGSGAKGGVINIITREINENQTIADASVGSFGRKDTKFSTMGKAGKLTYNFSQGTYKQGDVTDGRGEKWEGHTKTNNFGGKVTYNFTDNNKLTLDYMDIHSNFGGTDLIYSNFYSGKYDSTMWSIRDDWQIDKNWSNTFVYRQNEEKRQHQQQYFVGNVLKNSDTDFKYTFISDQITFHNDRHNLVMGVDYSQGKDQQTTLVNGVGVKREMKNTSFYINEDWTIVPHVTLSGGLRHDRPNEDKYGSKIDSHTTKSYKLAWDVTKKDTVYAGRSEYFILPSMSQLYDKEWGNEGLKPAEGRTESIGYNKKFNDNNFLTVNYFQTKEDCGIGWDGYNRVNTSGVSRGWNAQFSSRLSDKWNFNVGWSHLFEHSDGDDNYTLGYYPRDLATFGVYYNVGKFDAGLDGYWFFRKMDYSGKREFPADNYGIYNLSMNYKPTKNMKLYCKVENIFNKYYAEHTDAGSDPYLTGDGDRKYYAMPGRAFMVGLEFKF